MPISLSPRKKIFFVYALLDPTKPGPFRYGRWRFSHEPFYIGKGKGLRPTHHTSQELVRASGSAKSNRIQSILAGGKQPIVSIKKRKLTEKRAFSYERRLIAKIGRADREAGPLTNRTNGGNGGHGTLISAVTRRRIGTATLGSLARMTNARRLQGQRARAEGLRRYWATVSKKRRKQRAEISRENGKCKTEAERRRRGKECSARIKKYWASIPQNQRSEMQRVKALKRWNA